MVAEGFTAAVHTVADTLGPLTDEASRDFMQRFPLDATFRELSMPNVGADVVDATCLALGKVFDTSYGASLLPAVLPYASAALQSPAPRLRRLAAQQLGRLLGSPTAEPAARQQALQLLLQALQDADVGVASAAEGGMKQLGSTQQSAPQQQADQLGMLLDPSAPAGQALRGLAECEDPVRRMRSLTLLVALASHSPAAAQAVRQSGLLEPLLRELQDPEDLLSCMAALQLVRDAAEQCDPGMALALQDAVLPRLGALLQHPEPVLQSGALKAAASLLSTSLEVGAGPMAVDGGPAAAGNGIDSGGGATAAAAAVAPAQPLLTALKAVLDVGGTREVPAEVEQSALDAVGILGLQWAGADALLTDPSNVTADVAYKALGRAPGPAQRIAALHTLATVAGAERSGRSGKLLSPAAEAVLRVAVFEGASAAGAGATPAQVMEQHLSQPFLEQRVAVYRFLAALSARDWMAGEVCSHPPLLAFLLNPQSESGKQGCEWRHACVSALAGTVADVLAGGVGAGGPHQAALAAAAERVQAAVRAGPFGAAARGPAEFLVATEPGQ